MINKIFYMIIFVLLINISNLYSENVNQELKERLIKLEVKVEEGFKVIDQRFISVDQLFKSVDQRFDSMQIQLNDLKKQLDDIKSYMLWGFGILLTWFLSGIAILIGFVLWDRRTFLKPVADEIKDLQKQQNIFYSEVQEVKKEQIRMKETIISFAKKDKNMYDSIQSFGINVQPV